MKNYEISSYSCNKFYLILSHTEIGDSKFKDQYSKLRYGVGLDKVEDIRITSKKAFFRIMKRIKEEIKNIGVLPYIHFECHGCPNGLSLEGKGTIKWSDLSSHLTEINILSKNNLFLSFATCYASHFSMYLWKRLSDSTSPSKLRAPFFAMTAPTDETTDGVLEIYEEYFQTFSETVKNGKSFNIQECFQSLIDNGEFLFISGELLLRVFLEQCLKNEVKELYESPIKLNAHLTNIRREFFLTSGRQLSWNNSDVIARQLTNKDTFIQYCSQFQSTFLMLDIYPDQSNRFKKTHDFTDWKLLVEQE